MSAPIDIIAILHPKPGKADRLQEILTATAKEVKAKEPGALRYHLQREIRGDVPTLVMLETFKDQAAFEEHGKSEHMRAMGKAAQEEDLLAEPMKLLFTRGVARYASRL